MNLLDILLGRRPPEPPDEDSCDDFCRQMRASGVQEVEVLEWVNAKRRERGEPPLVSPAAALRRARLELRS